MKSSFFQKHDLDTQFRQDMKTVLDAGPAVAARLPDFARNCLLAPTTRETERVCDRASSELGIPRVQLDRALSVTQFLLMQLTPEGDASGDDLHQLLDDLRELLSFDDDKATTIRVLLEGLKKLAKPDLRVAILQRAHEQSALPILDSVDVEVDFRAVFDNSYKYDEDVSSYSPRFLGSIPLGIVRLKLDGAAQKDVFLQLNMRSLQILIDSLLALQKEVKVAETHLAFGKSQ